MENKSGPHSSLPPNYVTIKDLKERLLKRRQEQQQQQLPRELQEPGKEKDEKQQEQQQSESRSWPQPLHFDPVNRGGKSNSSGLVQTGRGAGKSGRIAWDPPVQVAGPGGRHGDRKPESGRWWSHKESGGNPKVGEKVVGGGADSRRQDEASGGSGSSGKGVRDQPVSKSQSLVVENAVEATGTGGDSPLEVAGEDDAPLMNAVKQQSEEMIKGAACVLPEEVARRGVFSRKGPARDSSRLRSKSKVAENGEMVAGDGQALLEGATGEGPSSKKGRKDRHQSRKKGKGVVKGVADAAAGNGEAPVEGPAGKSVTSGKGMRDESRFMAGENQVEAAEVSSGGGLKHENEIKSESKSKPVKNGVKVAGGGELVPPEEAASESSTARSRNRKKHKGKGKGKKDVAVESKVTQVEDGPRDGDAIRVNVAVEVEGQLDDMLTEDNDRKEEGPRPRRRGDGGHRKDSRRMSDRRMGVRKQIVGEIVWVKKGETANGS